MDKNLVFKYDRVSDTLFIYAVSPYPEQVSEEIGDEVVARLNPKTNQVEGLEILFFSTRFLRKELLKIPVSADMKLIMEEIH